MRLRNLDILRGIAVVLVLGRHMDPLPESSGALTRLTHIWYQSGWIGVDLFFVLSGYLVSCILFREYRTHGSLQVFRFLGRRALKIYPAFYAFLAGTLLLRYLGVATGRPPRLLNTVSELLFIQNYRQGLHLHTWSLAIEEHFYLSLPLVLLLFLRLSDAGNSETSERDPFRGMLPLAIVVGIICLAARLAFADDAPYSHRTHLFPTHLRLDSLYFGVAVGYLSSFRGELLRSLVQRHTRALVLLSVMFLLPMLLLPIAHPFVHTWGLTWLYLGFGSLLLLSIYALPDSPPQPGIESVIAAIGIHSYSIYLWHIPAKYLARELLSGVVPQGGVSEMVVYMVASVAAGVMMARLVEAPALRAREQWFPAMRRRLHAEEGVARDRARAPMGAQASA